MADRHLKEVPELLEESGPGFISLTLEADDYFEVMRGALRYGRAVGMHTALLSSSMPEAELTATMAALEEPVDHVEMIDCMSDLVMSPKSGEARHVEGPRLLEMALLELRRSLRSADGPSLIIVDSINSLMIHNSKPRTMAFLEALYGRVARGGHTLALLHISEEGEGVSIPNLRLISDRVLVLE